MVMVLDPSIPLARVGGKVGGAHTSDKTNGRWEGLQFAVTLHQKIAPEDY